MPGTYWPTDELRQTEANNGLSALQSITDDATAKLTPPAPAPQSPSFTDMLKSYLPWESGQPQQPQQPPQQVAATAAPKSFSEQLSSYLPWAPQVAGGDSLTTQPGWTADNGGTAPRMTGSAPVGTGDGSWESRARAAAVQAGHPNPNEFVEQMRWESGGFDPNVISGARNSPAGAQGIAQIMPDVARSAGVNPLDADAALRYAAGRMANNYRTYGDSAHALAEYNMGSGNLQKYGPTGLPETAKYISVIQGRTPPPDQQPAVSAAPVRQQFSMPDGTYTGDTADLVPNQLSEGMGQGLSREEALAVCGPAAAVAFSRANGRNPTLLEAKQMAQTLGLWDQGSGMHGPASEVQLLSNMGVPSYLAPGADEGSVAQSVQGGRPVIIDTPQHYFVAQGYDPTTRQFDFGQSANVLARSGGRTRYRLDELPSLGMGAPRSTIYMGQR